MLHATQSRFRKIITINNNNNFLLLPLINPFMVDGQVSKTPMRLTVNSQQLKIMLVIIKIIIIIIISADAMVVVEQQVMMQVVVEVEVVASNKQSLSNKLNLKKKRLNV